MHKWRLGSATLRVLDLNMADIDVIFDWTLVAHSVRWDGDGAVMYQNRGC
jgi:hypothetical protein